MLTEVPHSHARRTGGKGASAPEAQTLRWLAAPSDTTGKRCHAVTVTVAACVGVQARPAGRVHGPLRQLQRRPCYGASGGRLPCRESCSTYSHTAVAWSSTRLTGTTRRATIRTRRHGYTDPSIQMRTTTIVQTVPLADVPQGQAARLIQAAGKRRGKTLGRRPDRWPRSSVCYAMRPMSRPKMTVTVPGSMTGLRHCGGTGQSTGPIHAESGCGG